MDAAPKQLKRALNLPLLTLYGLGSIVGAGIYVLIGEVAGKAGMHAPLSFLAAAVIAAFTGLSYAELAARYPRSAGEAHYVAQAFGRAGPAYVTGWLIILTGMVSSATLTSGVVGYIALFVDWPGWMIIVLFVALLTLVACWGISQSAWSSALLTILSIAGLLLVVVAARANLAELPDRWPELVPDASVTTLTGIVAGSFLAFYAFIGFEDMVNVAEEVRDPGRTMPAALLLALAGAATLYILVATTAVLAVPPAQLAGHPAPLVAIAGDSTWLPPLLIGAFSIVAITSSVLPQLVMGSRVLFGLARQGGAPAVFSDINARTRTPVQATLLIAVAILALALAFPLVTLARMTSVIVLGIFAVINLAALWLKLTGRSPTETVSYPLWCPALGMVLCILLLGFEVFYRLMAA